jgi:hypothetical protein
MKDFIKKYILLIVGILSLIFILQKIKWLPSFENIFKSQPVVIDETPIVLREIKTLANLITITYTDEIVMDTAKIGNGLPSLLPTNIGTLLVPGIDKLVIIGRGKVLAGTDLKSIQPNDIYTKDDSVHLFLPKAKILQTIINPSGYETFEEKGKWTEEGITALKLKIKDEINKRAIRQNILNQADERGKNILETFLKNMGFDKVIIEFRN